MQSVKSESQGAISSVIAIIGIGANVGRRYESCLQAVDHIESLPGVTVRHLSSWYETEPVGYTDQPDFLNGVIAVETTLPPLELLRALKNIERGIGRIYTRPNGPRTIDLDILSYDDLIVEKLNLNLPHPRMTERAFVLVPLVEIFPFWVHPVLKKTATDLLNALGPVGTLVKPWHPDKME